MKRTRTRLGQFQAKLRRLQSGRELTRNLIFWIPTIAFSIELAADPWPQYRGRHRDGVSAEVDLDWQWPSSGPRLAWSVEIGPSFSGIAIVDNGVYTCDSDHSEDSVVRYNVDDGTVKWRASLGAVFRDNFGNGPRATPTVAGGRVFALGGHGRLVALNSKNGKALWSVELGKDLGGSLPSFGYSVSPLVIHNQVIFEVSGAGVVALDVDTGTVKWRIDSAEAAYSSPVLAQLEGTRQALFVNSEALLGIGLDGKLLWSQPFSPGAKVKPASPLLLAGSERPHILVSASYDIGSTVFEVTKSATSWKATTQWHSNQLRNHFNSSVTDGHSVIGFDNATLKSLDSRTGNVQWSKSGRLGKGSLILADQHLIVLTENGSLHVYTFDTTSAQRIASSDVLRGRSWTAPSLADGRLYVRNKAKIASYDLRPVSQN